MVVVVVVVVTVNFTLKTGYSGQGEASSKFMGASSWEKGNKSLGSLSEPGRVWVCHPQ